MKLTSRMIKDKAKELGIDCIAIGNIERFKDAPTLMSPTTYFPGAKSVIAVAMRIPRGSYRGIEEGTHWHNYTFYSYNKLNSLFRPIKSYELCCFIEDHGWEAVAHYPAVPEGNGTTRKPVGPDKVPADVVCSARIIAAGTGLGEIGFSKVFLTKKFGPRVRIGLIFTDCELEPDPILDTGTICLHCGACARECPGNAVPSVKDPEVRIEIDYGEKKVWYGDVQMGRCTLSHHGFNNECSPFHKKEFPNMAFDVRNTEMTEEEAYILCYSMANAKWSRKPDTAAVWNTTITSSSTPAISPSAARAAASAPAWTCWKRPTASRVSSTTASIRSPAGCCPTSPARSPEESIRTARSIWTSIIRASVKTNTRKRESSLLRLPIRLKHFLTGLRRSSFWSVGKADGHIY